MTLSVPHSGALLGAGPEYNAAGQSPAEQDNDEWMEPLILQTPDQQRAPHGSSLPVRGMLRTAWWQKLALTLCKLTGWTVRGSRRIPRGAVIAAGPHTSNQDFFVYMMTAYASGTRPGFLAKESVFRPPLGNLLRAIGGVPVRRGLPGGMVGQVAELLRADLGPIALMPAGTRAAGPWKSGFRQICIEADAPLYVMTCDYARKTATFYGPYHMTASVENDMRWVRACLDGVQGKHPEKNDLVQLAEEQRPS